MALLKNTASQIVVCFAVDVTTKLPQTGDAANITCIHYKDGISAGALADVNPAEMGGGLYYFALTATETNADHLAFTFASTTANISIVPVYSYTAPGTPTVNVTQWGGAMVGSMPEAATFR